MLAGTPQVWQVVTMSSSRPLHLAQPLTLPNGIVLKNRIGKAPLTEGLADPMNRATGRHVRLYGRWAEGGAAVVVTGNVQIDRRYLERPGNVVIDGNGGLDALRAYAQAGTANGTQLWMQINHPGRQTPRRVCEQPVAPSAVPLALPESAFAHPRAMTPEEVADVPRRFAEVATIARQAGFTGVQVHAAHGYLLSQFLTPLVNRRDDRWGGDIAARASLLLEVVRAVRAATAPGFCISVKLNSSDFQQGGFSTEDCLQVVRWLGEASVDLIEISGGNYEKPAMMGSGAKESTVRREAYFLDYARLIKAGGDRADHADRRLPHARRDGGGAGRGGLRHDRARPADVRRYRPAQSPAARRDRSRRGLRRAHRAGEGRPRLVLPAAHRAW